MLAGNLSRSRSARESGEDSTTSMVGSWTAEACAHAAAGTSTRIPAATTRTPPAIGHPGTRNRSDASGREPRLPMPDAGGAAFRRRLAILPGLSRRGPGLVAGHSLYAALIGAGGAGWLRSRPGFAARHPGRARFRSPPGAGGIVLGVLARLQRAALRPGRRACHQQARDCDCGDKNFHQDTSCWRVGKTPKAASAFPAVLRKRRDTRTAQSTPTRTGTPAALGDQL